MSAAMYKDREQPDKPAIDRADYIELEAHAFHDSDNHAEPFSTCKLGCWEAAEVEVEKAIFGSRLQLVAVD